MIDEKEKLQAEAAEAVETIEKEIKAAEAIRDERITCMDKLRNFWNGIAYQSTIGCWCIKIIQTLVVFVSLNASVRYGLAAKGSLLGEVVALLPETIGNVPILILAAEIFAALVWLWAPPLGTFFCAAFCYLSFAGISPIALIPAFLILILFQLEDRAVTALLIALPAMVFLSPLNLSLFVVILAAYISTRNNNGIVKTMGFVYFALLELCNGFFGVVLNRRGTSVISAVDNGVEVIKELNRSLSMLTTGSAADPLFQEVLILLAVFFVIGAVFSKLLNMRYSGRQSDPDKRLQIDVKDGIVFAILLALLCAAPTAVFRFSIMTEFGYSYASIALQTVAAYLVTRPIAGKSPKRGESVLSGDKNYIFISYAHSDIDRVKPYLKILSKKGYEFWYDDSIRTGTEWQGVIASNLTNCSCFLAFISKASVSSNYCLKEINYATSKNKPMAVIMLDDVMLPPVLEMHLASLQAVQRDKFDSDTECMQKVFEMEQLDRCKY